MAFTPKWTATANCVSTTGVSFAVSGTSVTSEANALLEMSDKLACQVGTVLTVSVSRTLDPAAYDLGATTGDNGNATLEVTSASDSLKKKNIPLPQCSRTLKAAGLKNPNLDLTKAEISSLAIHYEDGNGLRDYVQTGGRFHN